MSYFPINLNLKNRRCLVIGGGEVAERKVEALLDFGAAVTVIAPEITSRLNELVSAGSVLHIARVYEPGDIEGAFLVIAATDDRETNRAISEEAQGLGILVNVVDDPELCTFFVPAIIRRGDLVVAISTSGKSPAMAKWVREKLEPEVGPEYGALADLLGEIRDEVKAKYPNQADRNLAYRRILESDVLSLLKAGKLDEARKKARECI